MIWSFRCLIATHLYCQLFLFFSLTPIDGALKKAQQVIRKLASFNHWWLIWKIKICSMQIGWICFYVNIKSIKYIWYWRCRINFFTNILFMNWIYGYYEHTHVRNENKTVENFSLMFKFDLFSFDEKDVEIFLLFLPHTNILAFSVIVLCMWREYLFVDCMIKFSFPSEMFYFPNQTGR